jgi:hypothetical protein
MAMFDTNVFISHVFISHAANDFGTSAVAPRIAGWCDVVVEVREAVRGLRPGAKTRSSAEQCLAAFRRLQALPDWVWDALEPVMVDEIAVLNDLCATDEDLQ